MSFQKGHKLATGRPKGAINRKTREFQEVLEKHEYNVAETYIYLFNQAGDLYKKSDPFDFESSLEALKVMASIADSIASYSLPKLKSVEVRAPSPVDDMTDQERLMAAREYVELLEQDLKEVTPKQLGGKNGNETNKG